MRRLIAALASPRYKPSDEMVAYRHRLSVDPPTQAALKAINEITKQGGLIYPDDEIRGVTAPTLVVNGKLDQVSTITRALRFLELIPNSWGYILPHCGHWVMIEAPEDFCGAVTTFLKKPE
jgi:pimeloyl-ACP methyl ester carboxylesterase